MCVKLTRTYSLPVCLTASQRPSLIYHPRYLLTFSTNTLISLWPAILMPTTFRHTTDKVVTAVNLSHAMSEDTVGVCCWLTLFHNYVENWLLLISSSRRWRQFLTVFVVQYLSLRPQFFGSCARLSKSVRSAQNERTIFPVADLL